MGRLPLVLLLVCLPAAAQVPDRATMLKQVDASDLLARWLEVSGTSASTRPAAASGMAYDQVLKVVSTDSADADRKDLDELNDYELSQLLRALQIQNVEQYIASQASEGMDSPAAVRKKILAIRVSHPGRSKLFLQYIAPPEMEVVAADQVHAAAARMESMEPPDPGQMTPDQMVAAALSGDTVGRAFGIPSTLAPLDARMPGSRPFDHSILRGLPLTSEVPESLAFRADAPGNPSVLVPTREQIARLSAALGVTPQLAEEIAAGRMTLAEARQQGAGTSAGPQAELMGGLTTNDPRWTLFYYGPQMGVRQWLMGAEDSFSFQPGGAGSAGATGGAGGAGGIRGGRFVRSDQRVNQDSDMRTNGQLDRRVNISNDRRTTIQVDPRANY